MMLRNLYGRRVLVTPGWAHFASVAAERDQLKRDLEWTKRDLAMAQQSVREHRDTLNELLATRRAREMKRNSCGSTASAIWHVQERPSATPTRR
jgi:hypothetical protein